MAREAQAHDRIVLDVRGRIERGELRPGDDVESESALAATFGVSRGTVRAALSTLEKAGVLETIPAKGRRVRDHARPDGPQYPAAQGRAVAAELRAEILDSRLAPGTPFYSERDVSVRFDVSRYTARAALGELETAGLIIVRHGQGRFIAPADGA